MGWNERKTAGSPLRRGNPAAVGRGPPELAALCGPLPAALLLARAGAQEGVDGLVREPARSADPERDEFAVGDQRLDGADADVQSLGHLLDGEQGRGMLSSIKGVSDGVGNDFLNLREELGAEVGEEFLHGICITVMLPCRFGWLVRALVVRVLLVLGQAEVPISAMG